ncbi:MAG: hypothetical protein JNL84_00790 [Candidatus Accumulibacter sp.]|nr:hypothetical protein [Accumulibacter sp.]
MTAGGGFVDLEFTANLAAGGIVALPEDTSAIAVLRLGTPHHHEPAIAQCGDARFILITGGVGIDQENIG